MTRLADFAAAVRRSRELDAARALAARAARRASSAAVRRARRHAAAHSRFYRDWDGEPLDKATMMERFDDIVIDPRLRRDALLAHVERSTGDELYLGRYRAMTTSGSSGRKGLFVYDRPEWVALMAQFLRFNALAGIRPRLPAAAADRRGREPDRHAHEPPRRADRSSIGVHRVLRLPVTAPMPRARRAAQRLPAAVAERVPVDGRRCSPRSSARAGCGSRPSWCRPAASC